MSPMNATPLNSLDMRVTGACVIKAVCAAFGEKQGITSKKGL